MSKATTRFTHDRQTDEAAPAQLARIFDSAAAIGLTTDEVASLSVVVQGKPLIKLNRTDADNLRAVLAELSAAELRDLL